MLARVVPQELDGRAFQLVREPHEVHEHQDGKRDYRGDEEHRGIEGYGEGREAVRVVIQPAERRDAYAIAHDVTHDASGQADGCRKEQVMPQQLSREV